MDKVVYDTDWYLYPTELQKYEILMLAVIREPIVIDGLFSMSCSRETFKRVNTKYFLAQC